MTTLELIFWVIYFGIILYWLRRIHYVLDNILTTLFQNHLELMHGKVKPKFKFNERPPDHEKQAITKPDQSRDKCPEGSHPEGRIR